MPTDFKVRLTIFIFLFVLGVSANIYADDKIINRAQAIENGLQAAKDQARLEGTEQSQENFLRIQQKVNEGVMDINAKDDFLNKQKIFHPRVPRMVNQHKKVFVEKNKRSAPILIQSTVRLNSCRVD